MTFREAVEAAPAPVAAAVRQGIQALGGNSRRVSCGDPRRFTGSVDLDAALWEQAPAAPRWDYGIGLRRGRTEAALWIEVHPTDTSEVRTVLGKLQWLKNWLRDDAAALFQLTARDELEAYYWVATRGVHIRPGTPQARQLQMAGLSLPRARIELT